MYNSPFTYTRFRFRGATCIEHYQHKNDCFAFGFQRGQGGNLFSLEDGYL